MHQNILRTIPSVNELIESPEISKLTDLYPRLLVVDTVREVLEDVRQSLLGKENTSPQSQNKDASSDPLRNLYPRIEQVLRQKLSGVEHAINATGIILHTGLGRAPLADEAAKQLQDITKSFCTLEIEKHSGRRGIRYHTIEQLICALTGTESALVVNNNAAAVLLVLDTLARGKEAVISRSQLVEIGGSFRMPDVMVRSGVVLAEVGTTNKTYLKDYENAITGNTGLILKVHQSNFKIVGFTETVDLKDLVSLGQTRNIPVVYDLGSGALIDLRKYGLPHEPTVQEGVAAGVDVVTFSTDKLLGGPQGGIVAGKKKWIEPIKKNPLTRALRVGKLTVAALEATLRLYLAEDPPLKKIPVLNMMLAPLEEVAERCKKFIDALSPRMTEYLDVSMVDGFSEMGGGSLPGENIPTKRVCIHSGKIPARELADKLRDATPPVFARIEQDRVYLDMRTVCDAEVGVISRALENVCGS